MSARRVVIIGGVAGGMSAATRLRRLDETAEITVLEKSGNVSYANCGLPYYVGGEIQSRDSILLQTPHSLWERFRIRVHVSTEATTIDREAHTVTARDTVSGLEQRYEYDSLILSPGAHPRLPDIPGAEHASVLRTVEDADHLHELASGRRQPRAVIVGGGFIGVELAENLVRRGIETHIVEFAPTILPGFDQEMIRPFGRHLEDSGVRVHLNTGASAITADSVTLTDGTVIEDAFTVLSVGVVPETSLAAAAGLSLGRSGGIAVDEQLRTSDPDIFAVGDAVEKATDQGSRLIPLANLANRHGRLVADVIAGLDSRTRPAIGTAIVTAFGLAAAMTGMSERAALAAGRSIRVVHLHPNSHATYYPGAKQFALKLVLDAQDGTILGAQAVGAEGIDKRIDVIATAIAGGLRGEDLMDLELAYAPQFGSAKDAINMAGYVIDNVTSGLSDTIQWHELDGAIIAGATLIDVRTSEEHAGGGIPSSVNIPLDELRERLDEITGEDIIVHCKVGQRGHTAARLLTEHGLRVRNLDGGWLTWQAARA